jgi:hypothetical protein
MSLKTDRYEFQTDISFFMNEVATRGGVVSLSAGGSGAAMDQGAALVTYASNPSGKMPVGILLQDMVNLDLTRQHINWHKDEVQKGGKVCLLRKGYVVTNNVQGTAPAAGDPVYVAHSGNMSKTDLITPLSTQAQSIGVFLSNADEDGYYKVEINLPVVDRRNG